LYQAFAYTRQHELLFKRGHELFKEKLEHALLATGKSNTQIPMSILANHLAGSLILLLRWWLDNNRPYTPEQMDEIFHKLVMPGVWAALDQTPGPYPRAR
jgi:hypothetical protein